MQQCDGDTSGLLGVHQWCVIHESKPYGFDKHERCEQCGALRMRHWMRSEYSYFEARTTSFLRLADGSPIGTELFEEPPCDSYRFVILGPQVFA